MYTQVVGQLPVQSKVNGVATEVPAKQDKVQDKPLTPEQMVAKIAELTTAIESREATIKKLEDIRHFDEVMTPTMKEAVTELQLTPREREEMVEGAVRNAVRTSLKTEFNKLKTRSFDRQKQMTADGVPYEKMTEQIHSLYGKKISKLEQLHKDLER